MALTSDWAVCVFGASAGINSARFYACPACGAVVMERDQSETNRQRHERWHDELR